MQISIFNKFICEETFVLFEASMDEVHRLEAPEQKPGGLFIKKKDGEKKKENDGFKVPTSKFGLDLLAKKLKKEREMGLLTSFRDHDDEIETKHDADDTKHDDMMFKNKAESKSKNYRTSKTETPSHTGGVSQSVRELYRERVSDKSKGIYASSKDKDKDRKSLKSSSRHRDRNRDRKRSRYDRSDRSDRSDHRRSDRSSYRRRDEPETPRDHFGRSSVGKTSWDDDDEEEYLRSKKKRSSWDFPTPDIPYKGRPDDSVRSYRSVKAATSSKRIEDDTPRATPAHKYNKWMGSDRKQSGATPRTDKNSESKQPWNNEEDRDLWEEEQLRLDREWYNMDEGYDDENNPFHGASGDYLKKREEQIELKKRKRISAQQRQINKDNELWEKNRMITSGVVTSINVNEDFEEETVDRVHLLVHHTIPPFLDGRIVFTKVMGKWKEKLRKQCKFLKIFIFPEPVIPVKDPTSDMALVARKGSALVRVFREQKERRKAQKKHWDLGGTKLGNIIGIEKKKDDEDGKFDADTDTADYKKDQKFAEHMQKQEQGSSDFARRKTMIQQRQYLPVFAVRQDLLNVIRENSVVIIVGVSNS